MIPYPGSREGAKLPDDDDFTSVQTAEIVLEKARDLAQRTMGIVANFCGGVPTPQGNAEAKPQPPQSVFEGLRSNANRALDDINSAQQALNRLVLEISTSAAQH